MPFGMKISPATFQRLVNKVISGLDGVAAYIDDVIIYSKTWEEHLRLIRPAFEFQLTVNLNKSEFWTSWNFNIFRSCSGTGPGETNFCKSSNN